MTHSFAPRHIKLWQWAEELTPGQRPRPFVAIWPRGGAKSSTAELMCARLGITLQRRFVLYVSATQEQADKHVGAVAGLFEQIGVERAVGKYGHSKGWRRSQLVTSSGFSVAALGLDTASRGIKLDQFRPDLMVFDDVDVHDDSPKIVENKIADITTAIMPAGSTDCAVLVVQNLIHEGGIVYQIWKGTADFLLNRICDDPEPAIRDLDMEIVTNEDGSKSYRITQGTPTWDGQSVEVAEKQLNDWGKRAFLREAQQDVSAANGVFFDVSKLIFIDASDVPPLQMKALGSDLAATEGGGDHTALVEVGIAENRSLYVLKVDDGQWGAHKVMELIRRRGEEAGCPGECQLIIPQDPGQAGKWQAGDFHERFGDLKPRIRSVTGNKATRATRPSEEVAKGNVYVVKGEWTQSFVDELRLFREDEPPGQLDNRVDAFSDAVNWLVRQPRRNTISRRSSETRAKFGMRFV